MASFLLTFACWLALDGRKTTADLDWDTLAGLPAITEIDTSGRPPMNPPPISGRWSVVSGQCKAGGCCPVGGSCQLGGNDPACLSPTADHRPQSTSSPAAAPAMDERPAARGCRDWYRGARDAFMAEPGGPPLWILMTLNGCPACEVLERDLAWVQAMRRAGHFAVFVYDEDRDFGNTIASNVSRFPCLVRFRWDAGQIRADVLTGVAAIRRLPGDPGQWSAMGGRSDMSAAISSLSADHRPRTTSDGGDAGTKER
jgi:hypothetical protein